MISGLIRTARRGIVFLLIAFATTAGLHGQSSITSSEGGFAAIFPTATQPERSSSPIETDVGQIEMVTFMATEGDFASMVAYSDYPIAEIQSRHVDAMLDSAREGALRNLNGRLIRQRRISIDGHPGRSIFFRGKSQGFTIYGRFDYYVVSARLYQVGYITTRQKDVDARKTKAFFASFKLLSQPTPE